MITKVLQSFSLLEWGIAFVIANVIIFVIVPGIYFLSGYIIRGSRSAIHLGVLILGGYIIRGNRGAIRLGVLISVLWVVVSFVALEPYNRSYPSQSWTEFFEIGIIPVISYWGVLWVISGFLSNKNKMENS